MLPLAVIVLTVLSMHSSTMFYVPFESIWAGETNVGQKCLFLLYRKDFLDKIPQKEISWPKRLEMSGHLPTSQGGVRGLVRKPLGSSMSVWEIRQKSCLLYEKRRFQWFRSGGENGHIWLICFVPEIYCFAQIHLLWLPFDRGNYGGSNNAKIVAFWFPCEATELLKRSSVQQRKWSGSAKKQGFEFARSASQPVELASQNYYHCIYRWVLYPMACALVGSGFIRNYGNFTNLGTFLQP